jgi:hypothetical protein
MTLALWLALALWIASAALPLVWRAPWQRWPSFYSLRLALQRLGAMQPHQHRLALLAIAVLALPLAALLPIELGLWGLRRAGLVPASHAGGSFSKD